MDGVLTQEDFDKQNDLKDNKQDKGRVLKPAPEPEKPKEDIIEYIFLHPEAPQHGFINRVDIIKLGDKKYKRTCIDNVVKTRQKVLADYLKSKSWDCVEEIKIKRRKD